MRTLVATFLLFVLLSSVVVANSVPTAENIFLTAWTNTPLVFSIVVEDTDIDPWAPELHPISFSVDQSPSNGLIAGDLAQVLYSEPNRATLVLTYSAADDFAGFDEFYIKAEDPNGEAVNIRVSVEILKRGTMSTLTGSFLATTTIDVQTGSITSTNVSGTVKYSLYATAMEMGYRLKRETAADDLFDDLYFTLTSPFGGFGSLSGRVDFNPELASDLFDYASLSLTAQTPMATLSGTVRTDGTEAGSSLVLVFSGATIDGLSFSSRASFVPCESVFSDATTSMRFQIPGCGPNDCDISVSASASFSNDGFEALTISTSNVQFPDVAWLNFATAGSVTLSYKMQTKSITISPQFSVSWLDCIRFGTVINWTGLSATSIEFRSIHLDHTFDNGIRLRMDTSLDPMNMTLNQSVTGHLDYWERDTISGSFNICNGIGGDWEVSAYFARPLVGNSLFDWGMLVSKLDIYCGNSWRFFIDLTFRSGDFGGSTCELLIGGEFYW